MITTILTYCRYAIAILLGLIGLRGLLHLITSLVKSGEELTRMEIALIFPVFFVPCTFLAAAYLLVFHRFRMFAWVVFLVGAVTWIPSLLKHLAR